MELRKDYLLERYVIVSQARGKRPHQFGSVEIKDVNICYFCPTHESLTPEEILRVPDENNGWLMRVFANKFAAAAPEGNPVLKTDNTYFTYASAYGYHEVIVETPNHASQLWDLTNAQLFLLLQLYNNRIRTLSAQPEIRAVTVFKNAGKDAGASLPHAHTQIIATALPSPQIQEELSAIKKHAHCPYCDIIATEKESSRRCYENEHFVAFTPYASRFHYELWIFSKTHVNTCVSFSNDIMQSLTDILYRVLQKLKEINASYNYYLHLDSDPAFHFHIEITPRLALFAGFEYASEITINSVAPEDAAAFYRGDEHE